jgi:hypothetical protein
VFSTPEIPTTLPTLDEVYGRPARAPSALADRYRRLLRPGALEVHTVHAELEGGPHLPALEALLDAVAPVARIVRLCDAAASLAEVPVCAVREGRLPGRAIPVALQGDAVVPPPA